MLIDRVVIQDTLMCRIKMLAEIRDSQHVVLKERARLFD
jgi:hypothetical protein